MSKGEEDTGYSNAQRKRAEPFDLLCSLRAGKKQCLLLFFHCDKMEQ